MLRRMAPATYLFVVLFGERTWANEFAFAAWPRSQIDDWAGGNSMGVSVCASLWVGRECYEVYHECEDQDVLLSKQDSYWVKLSREEAGSQFLRLSRLRSCACTGLQVGQFRVFCESVPRQVLLVGLLVIPGAATGTQVLQFDKKWGAYHTSFNHQRSTKSPSQTQKCMWIKGVTRWRELESTYCVTIISARNTGTWAFFSNAVFNHFPLEDFSQTNGNRLVGAPRTHFRQKLKIDK